MILLGCLGLAACGNTRLDRAVSGAGLGAAGGAAVGAIAGGPILGAAAVGAVAGGAVGAITEKHQINLGKAWWEH
jgi:hypothetical protein